MIEIEARQEAAAHAERLDAVFAALADPTRGWWVGEAGNNGG